MPIPHKTEELKRESAKQHVYTTLRGWIVNETLQPGERINEQELCHYFNVSRTPVREAIQLLQAQKLVEIIPNKSTVVTEIDRNKPEKWYLPMAHLHGLAAKLACDNMSQQDYLALEALNEQMKARSIAGDVGGTLSADAQFHNLLLDIAGNEFIKEFSDTLITHIERFEFRFYSGCETFSPHDQVLEALRQRDGALAFEAIRENWLTTLTRYRQDRAR